MTVLLRPAVPTDVPVLQHWDRQPRAIDIWIGEAADRA